MAGYTQSAVRGEAEKKGIRSGVTKMAGAGTGHHLAGVRVYHAFADRMRVAKSVKRMATITKVNVALGVQQLSLGLMEYFMTVETFVVPVRFVDVGAVVGFQVGVASALEARPG